MTTRIILLALFIFMLTSCNNDKTVKNYEETNREESLEEDTTDSIEHSDSIICEVEKAEVKTKENPLDYFNRPRHKRLIRFKKEDYREEKDNNLTEAEKGAFQKSFGHSGTVKKEYSDSVIVSFYIHEVYNISGNIKVDNDNIDLEYFPFTNPGETAVNEAGIYKLTYTIKKNKVKEKTNFVIVNYRDKLRDAKYCQ